MNINFELVPLDNTPNNNTIPLQYSITNSSLDVTDNFVSIINIIWDELKINIISPNISQVNEAGEPAGETQLAFGSVPHNYLEGDKIFLIDSNNQYTGYYNVLKSYPNYVVVDMQYLNAPGTVHIYHYTRYKMKPRILDKARIQLDLQDVLKDKVGTAFIANNIKGDEYFKYDIIIGEEYNYVYHFDDTIFISGNVGYYNDSLTLTDLPFKVGDEVNINLLNAVWLYLSVSNYSGKLQITSNSNQYFNVGDTLLITQMEGQDYNGYAKVLNVIDNKNIVVDVNWTGNISNGSGRVFGNPVPNYGGNAKITAIDNASVYYSGMPGIVIVTNIGWTQSTVTTQGRMRLINNRKFIDNNVTSINDKRVRLARFDIEEGFDSNSFLPYIVKYDNVDTFKISTIKEQYKIGADIIGYLLLRIDDSDVSDNTISYKVRYDFYGETNTTDYIALTKDEAVYIPYGINELENSYSLNLPNRTYKMDVTIEITKGSNTVETNTITYLIDYSCGQPKNYNLIWLDKLGSYISYTFTAHNNKSTKVEKSSYQIGTNVIKESGGSYSTFNENYLRGEYNYYNKAQNIYHLVSDWIKDSENNIFEDLMTSPDVYIQIDDDIIPVILNNKELEYKSNFSSEMIYNYSFDVTLSKKNIRTNNYHLGIKKYRNY